MHPGRRPRPGGSGAVGTLAAGYVFGRSTWGPNGTFYSLRFGPGRQVHGHDDHMGITYYSRGRNLIVNAGHTGYEVSPYRTDLRSPEAASTLVAGTVLPRLRSHDAPPALHPCGQAAFPPQGLPLRPPPPPHRPPPPAPPL